MSPFQICSIALGLTAVIAVTGCGATQESRSSQANNVSSSLNDSNSSRSQINEASSSAMSSASVSSNTDSTTSSMPSLGSAIDILQGYCTSCHFDTHMQWENYTTDALWLNAQNAKGESYINELDPENSLLLKRMTFYRMGAKDMPMDNANQTEPFTRAHYQKVHDWVVALAGRTVEPVGDDSVKVSQVFDENGLKLALECSAVSAQPLEVLISDPERFNASTIAGYEGIKVRAEGESSVGIQALTDVAADDSFWLTGAGLDIWESKIYFNALSTAITHNGDINMTLDVHQVEGLSHEFAKVGLLVSSSDDLTGELVFVHWAGQHGLAEDSGEAKLDTYRQIEKNIDTSVATTLPVRLKVVYENETLKVGGCYHCDSPAVGLPKKFNFKPKRIYIVASSHAPTPLKARLSLIDGQASKDSFKTVHTATADCTSGAARLSIPSAALANLERLRIEVRRGETLVAGASPIKSYSANASCAAQGALLEPKLRRLSELQIKNSVVDIFGNIFNDNVWPKLEDGAKLIGMNSNADKLNINNINFERMLDFSKAMTETLLAQHPVITACARETDEVCVTTVLTTYGKRLWRRPLSTDELAAFTSALNNITGNAEKLAFTLHALVLSSNFLFRSEIGVLLDGTAQYELTNFEVVAVLSYALLNSTPDDELLELASQTAAISRSQLEEQVTRLFQSPNASASMMEVYKDYLKLDLVRSRPKDESLGFSDDIRRDLLDSAELMLIDNIEKNRSFTNVFSGSRYVVNDKTADIFGVDYRDSQQGWVDIDSAQRSGLFNHPAFLAVHSTLAKSGIVKRGVFTLEQLLCQELPDAPGDVMPVPLPEGIDPSITSERELLQLTHSAQAACIGCHQVIDPAGFGFENFDTIGRYRTVEKGSVPIDASGVMDNIGRYVLSYGTSAEFSRELIDSPQLKACVATRFLENFLGQELAPSDCEATKYNDLIDASGSAVQDLLLSLIQLESFTRRELK
ncbi:DUF1588 domain-containing protein [Marinagarivorans algicola]|uniref:DUF1588 domain-containing protein n=1 Tax=Marinagarivorans algicola TaxID=1513270 RepID=UPI0006B9C16B|nr:DUF1588 domain-containing protein [Marinagarivorans algicola]